MIQGLKVRVSGAELKTHIQERATKHKEKSAFYQTQADTLASDAQAMANMSNNPHQGLVQTAGKHRAKHSHFQFMADHVVTDDTYELNIEDLVLLEIVTERW